MKKGILSFITVAALSVVISGNASAEEVNVQDGDTLWGIAVQKEVSVKDLIEWNDLSGDIIHPEDKLKIQEYYEIIKGDSLWDIAIENDVSVNDLKEWNEIDSHIIKPGDELIIDHKDNKEDDSSKAKPKQQETETTKVEKASIKPKQQDTKTTKVEKASIKPKQLETKTTKVENVSTKPAKQSDTKEITVEATAYTAYCEGCSGTTKTGIDLKANPNKKVIAVDPDVIPLGSTVHVEGYGEAIAGDIGGAIKGNRIDVFIPSKSQAKQWGRKDVQVKILD
ncbi:MAG: LysM peptidoglycan-binding domain-containing protein [Bacillota bacterium]